MTQLADRGRLPRPIRAGGRLVAAVVLWLWLASIAQAANYERMRARGVTIITELTPEYQAALRAAGQVAVDDWLAKMGPAGKDILDRYRQRR